MKLRYVLLSILVILLSATGCRKEEDFVTEPLGGLIDVTIPVGTDEESTKVWSGWNKTQTVNYSYWDKGDAIGVFAGADNSNRKFTLATEEDYTYGQFSGQMAQVTSPVSLIAYYPYAEGATTDRIPCPDLSKQTFEGTYSEYGQFHSLGRYSLLSGVISDFTITDQWPSGVKLTFSNQMAIIRFKITNSTAAAIPVKSVYVETSDRDTVFGYPTHFTVNSSTGETDWRGSFSKGVRTSISETDPLTIASSETKYVQMTVVPATFKENENLAVYVYSINGDNRGIRYRIPKTATKNFVVNTRTTVNVPIGPDPTYELAYRVKITTSDAATSLSAPVFAQGARYSADYSCWGDGKVNKYEAGQPHQFATGGGHTASFNHWGTSDSLVIETIDNITSIDFTGVFNNK